MKPLLKATNSNYTKAQNLQIDHSNKQNKYSKYILYKQLQKINNSDVTNHSSQAKNKKQTNIQEKGQKGLSLLDCKSSKSFTSVIEEQNQMDLKLAALFLQSQTQEQYIKSLKQMWNNYQNMELQNLVTFLRLEKDQNDIEGRLLSHYLGAWLYSMGYTKNSNKKYILSRIKMHLGVKRVSKAALLYDSMFKDALGLTHQGRCRIIIDICKNGWQTFINFMIKYLKNEIGLFKMQVSSNKYLTNLMSIDESICPSSISSQNISSNLKIQQFSDQDNLINFSKITRIQ